ncbi:hypothetical protein K431DRAFT_322534 [Polychaeton citri CBS 116435]|uniref:UBC core domain-containing protein n=1 Tax=Polychaeton citri CBS 116435 TaxID=1314669 RepID=A0A9P4UME2_9PEZI|nr:hypothetical protein K431DRAFT_322534 [Polychaeton citri CBS 116435]
MSRLVQCDAFIRQRLAADFASLKYACPQGLYVAPVPDEPLLWTGVLFVSRGPYTNAILRFEIAFTHDFPDRAPTVTINSDVFHPLVTPLTTYTYTGQDSGTETVSAADQARLPPGGVSLRHGFPEWFTEPPSSDNMGLVAGDGESGMQARARHATDQAEAPPASSHTQQERQSPHIVEVLQYLRVIFSSEAVLDTVPLEAAANSGAWHAWKSYRVRQQGHQASNMSPARKAIPSPVERSTSPKQQPGGARRPGDWNWQGVWEDRVRKIIQASITEQSLYGGGDGDVVSLQLLDVNVSVF